MKTSTLFVSILLLTCTLLSACATAVIATPLPPTDAPVKETPVRSTKAVSVELKQVANITQGIENINVSATNDRGPISAFDSIWFLSDTLGKVERWDPATRQVLATIEIGDPLKAPFGDPVAAVATSDALWVTSVAAHEIVKVDPKTNQIVDRIALPKVKLPSGSQKDFLTNEMVLVKNTIWVWDYDLKFAQGINLDTRQVVGPFTNIYSISTFEDSLWISDIKGIEQVDPQTGQVVHYFEGGSQLGIPRARVGDHMWGFSDNTVVQLDPKTNQVTAKFIFDARVNDIKAINDSLWVTVGSKPPACAEDGYLVRINPGTDSVTSKVSLNCPFDVIPSKDSFWVLGGGDAQLLLTLVHPG